METHEIEIPLNSISDIPAAYEKAYLGFKETLEQNEDYEIVPIIGLIKLKHIEYYNRYSGMEYTAVFEVNYR